MSLIITPLIIKMSIKIKATDKPNHRKVHNDPITTLGGLSFFLSFLVGLDILQPSCRYRLTRSCGALIIIAFGCIDDLYELSPKVRFAGQIAAALLVVFLGGLQVESVNLPFGGQVEFGFLSSIVTLLWIVGITNAINFIDGLDGLAGGVSAIALATIAVMAMIMGNVYVATMALILFFCTLGFLLYHVYPAKICMGDTGALFLVNMIAVLAPLGFKNVTIISFIIPVFILGVPISDTLLAMVRRVINNRPLSSPDSSHLHHRLLKLGLTHKQTVLIIYMLSGMFSIAAILFSMTTVWGSVAILVIALFVVQILVENLEMINSDFKPLTKLIKGLRERSYK